MTIQSGIRTPDTYLEVNLNAQRTGLPANVHKVLFVSKDQVSEELFAPVDIYDQSGADQFFGSGSIMGAMIKAAVKTNRLVDVQGINLLEQVDETTEKIQALGHTIIALSDAPENVDDVEAWVDHINFVSDAIEQRPAILVVPFSDLIAAEEFASHAQTKTSYRIVAACYNGAFDQHAQIAATIAAALANSNDPALPFNGVNLSGLKAVDDRYKLTFERQEAAMRKGVCIIETGADGTPEIVRALSTYQANPETGETDDIAADINCALITDYTRKVVRRTIRQNGRRKNTERERKNLRSLILVELIKLDDAQILQNVRARASELTVTADSTDSYRCNVKIPADWVRGMHVIAGTIDLY